MNTRAKYVRSQDRVPGGRRPITFTTSDSRRTIKALLVDVSPGGIGVASVENILPDNQIFITVGTRRIYLSLAWCQLAERKTLFRYGFKNLDPSVNLVDIFTAPGASMTDVLIVDDDEAIAEMYSQILTEHGFGVQTASSGTEALAIMDQKTFHVVLSDLHMAHGDGLSVVSGAKAHNIPVALITGDPRAHDGSLPDNVRVYDKLSLELNKMPALVTAVANSGR